MPYTKVSVLPKRKTSDIKFMNLAEACRPIIRLYRFFEITPITLTKQKPNQVLDFTTSGFKTKSFLRFLMLLLISLAPMPFDSQTIFIDNENEDNLMKHFNYTVEVLFLPIIIIYSYWNNMRREKLIYGVLNDLENIDIAFREFSLKISYIQQANRLLKKQLLCLGIITTIKLAFRIINDYDSFNIFLKIFSYDFHDLMIWLVMTQYYNLIFLVEQRLRQLNNCLKDIKRMDCGLLYALSKLQKIYGRLFSHCYVIDEVHSMQVLLVTAAVFQNLLSESYYMYRLIIISKIWNSDDIRQFLFTVKWICSNVMILTLLGARCNVLLKQSEKTAVLLHNLHFDAYDFAVSREIELFSLQLLHEKISFSAGGYFKIDLSLVYRVISAVAVYLIILIQFDSSNRNTST